MSTERNGPCNMHEEAHFHFTISEFEELLEMYGVERVMESMMPPARIKLAAYWDAPEHHATPL